MTNDSTCGALSAAVALFRADAARWVIPEERVPVDTVTVSQLVRLTFRHIPLRAMAWFRFGSAMRSVGVPGCAGLVERRLLRRYGLELATGVRTGGGLYIAHPVGCVLHATEIGENVSVISNVTFGHRDGRWPAIDADSWFGAGSRVIGGITVGRGARVGANAVVISDVPPGATAVGVPARIIPAPTDPMQARTTMMLTASD
jgi:serine O-acetyltransferase